MVRTTVHGKISHPETPKSTPPHKTPTPGGNVYSYTVQREPEKWKWHEIERREIPHTPNNNTRGSTTKKNRPDSALSPVAHGSLNVGEGFSSEHTCRVQKKMRYFVRLNSHFFRENHRRINKKRTLTGPSSVKSVETRRVCPPLVRGQATQDTKIQNDGSPILARVGVGRLTRKEPGAKSISIDNAVAYKRIGMAVRGCVSSSRVGKNSRAA